MNFCSLNSYSFCSLSVSCLTVPVWPVRTYQASVRPAPRRLNSPKFCCVAGPSPLRSCSCCVRTFGVSYEALKIPRNAKLILFSSLHFLYSCDFKSPRAKCYEKSWVGESSCGVSFCFSSSAHWLSKRRLQVSFFSR